MEQLHEHNQKTYENICHMYDEGIQRVAVVQPTGSGKSLLMAKLIEDNSDSRFFILSTSHKINDQFKSKLNEEALKRIDFNIYCNMPNMKQETMEGLQPDYILLDEMHRALAKEWSKGIKRLLEMYPDVKVLGLSATPIRYLDRCRNVVNELFDGNLACDMSLSEAILDGILPMARYVCGVYSYEKDTESLNKKIEKSTNSDEEKKELLKEVKLLKENLDKGNGVSDIFRKYIVTGNEKFVVFLKNTTHLREMKPVIKKWFIDAGFNVRMYEVHSKNVDSDKEFQAFKEDTEDGIIKLCLSIAMVTEGIHGDIDGVIMLRETISPNMYFQMIGRAFSCGKKTIPLIFDLVANSQFISDAVDNFPNELREEIEKRKKEFEKEGKEYEVGFVVDEFIVMDEFMDVVSGFKAIEGRLKRREWTEEEIEILKKWYPIEGSEVIKRLKDKTKKMIQVKASKMKLVSPHTWTKEDDELIEKYYLTDGRNIVGRFNSKSYSAIRARAQKLGILKKEYWTDEEDEILKQYYPLEGSSIYKRLDNKSRTSCRNRALKLGIQYISWTNEEDEIIRDMYYKFKGNVKEKSIEIHKMMPRKSTIAIENRFRRLGLYDIEKKHFISWTNAEDEIIKKYYPLEGSKVANRLKDRTGRQVISRAKKLGIKKEQNVDYDIDRLKELIKSETSIQNIAKIMKCGLGTLEYIMKKNGLEWQKREKTSKYKYVYYDKRRKKYNVEFFLKGEKIFVGSFENEEEAAKVAMQKAKEFGKAI